MVSVTNRPNVEKNEFVQHVVSDTHWKHNVWTASVQQVNNIKTHWEMKASPALLNCAELSKLRQQLQYLSLSVFCQMFPPTQGQQHIHINRIWGKEVYFQIFWENDHTFERLMPWKAALPLFILLFHIYFGLAESELTCWNATYFVCTID